MIDDEALKRIENLHRLKTEGVITEADFEKAKNDLLNGPAPRRPVASIALPRSCPNTDLPSDDDYLAWVLLPLKRYADFEGRSTRKEFWMLSLIHI